MLDGETLLTLHPHVSDPAIQGMLRIALTEPLQPDAAGACPAGSAPLYRVFDNRSDAHHRYTADRAVRDGMVARGWIAEGYGPDAVAMCIPQ